MTTPKQPEYSIVFNEDWSISVMFNDGPEEECDMSRSLLIMSIIEMVNNNPKFAEQISLVADKYGGEDGS